MISDEAVDAAARRIASYYGAGPHNWEWCLAEAKEALEAAAPFIAAQAWDEGRDAAHAEMARMYSSQCEGNCDCNEPIPNPYRSEK